MKRNCDTCKRSPMSVECGKCGTPDYKNFKSKEDEYLRCDECKFCIDEYCTNKEPCNGVNRFSSINKRKISFERYLDMNWTVYSQPNQDAENDLGLCKQFVDEFLDFHNVKVTNE